MLWNPNMKSHTSGMMSLGKGAIYGTSTKQKLNTKSSTKAELVGVFNDIMPHILWTRYFLEAQGYTVDDSIINQDNQSAMLLEENGRGSSSQRTGHINIQYFFVSYRVAAGEVKIQYYVQPAKCSLTSSRSRCKEAFSESSVTSS
jgi:hypothetical protein